MNLCLNILGILCILMLAGLAMVCVISFIENRRLQVNRYHIQDSHIPESFNGFRIVQLTDMHNTSFGKGNARLLERVSGLSPDIIVITGDMLVGRPGTDVVLAADTMNALCGIAPVYFSMGNHELRISRYPDKYGDMWERFLERLSPEVCCLFDKYTMVKNGDSHIYLYGVTLTPKLYTRFKEVHMPKKHLTNRFGVSDASDYNIFLAHNPEYFEDYAEWGANLIFSGHVHGGIVQLPFFGGVISPKMQLFPKYDKGLFEHEGKYMILSGGLGNHTLKFRVNNLPELVLVTLEHGADSSAWKCKE